MSEETQQSFSEIENAIVVLLNEDVRIYGRKDKEHKQQNAQEILKLNRVLQERFNISITLEYLYYLLNYYCDAKRDTNIKKVYRFLKALNLNVSDLTTREIYTTYRKLILYRTQDGNIDDEIEDARDFQDFIRAFRVSHDKRVIHLI